MKTKPRVFVAMSGGMDSTILAIHYLARKHPVSLVHFDYGQPNRKEKKSCIKLHRYLLNLGADVGIKIVSIPSTVFGLAIRTTPPRYERPIEVRNRNAVFHSLLAAIAAVYLRDEGPKEKAIISFGHIAKGVDTHGDATASFAAGLHAVMASGCKELRRVSLELPFANLCKSSLVNNLIADCKTLGANAGMVMRKTTTSLFLNRYGKEQLLYASDACRVEAFFKLGIQEHLDYSGLKPKEAQEIAELLLRKK